MKAPLCLFGAGAGLLLAQGVLAAFLPRAAVPDLSLLVVVAVAIWLRSTAGGLLLAAALGYCADALSGSLLGQQMLLAMGAYGAARYGAAGLNLRGALPQATFVLLLSVVHALALWLLVVFFAGPAAPSLARVAELLPRALVNAIAAPLVSACVARLLVWLGEDDGQRPLRLEPRTLAS